MTAETHVYVYYLLRTYEIIEPLLRLCGICRNVISFSIFRFIMQWIFRYMCKLVNSNWLIGWYHGERLLELNSPTPTPPSKEKESAAAGAGAVGVVGRRNAGWFPSSFVEEVESEHRRLRALREHMNAFEAPPPGADFSTPLIRKNPLALFLAVSRSWFSSHTWHITHHSQNCLLS